MSNKANSVLNAAGIFLDGPRLYTTRFLEAPNVAVPPNNVWYVDTAITTSGNGKTWTRAKKTLAEAIALCAKYDVVHIKGDITEADSGDMDAAMRVLAGSILAVHTGNERIDASAHTIEELIDFLQSMTAGQLKKVSEFLEEMPKLQHEAAFACHKCGSANELTLSGLSDFF